MDNVVFNVKGETSEDLLRALELGFSVSDHRTAEGFKIDKKKGLILYWSAEDDVNKFITPLTPRELLPQIEAFLNSTSAKAIELEGSDAEANDCEIDNDYGWRVYTENWGEINDNWRAFLAITPSYCWSGK